MGAGDYGVLVPARDATALAGALQELLGDRARLERMAGAAAQAGPTFAVETVLERTLALYMSLMP